MTVSVGSTAHDRLTPNPSSPGAWWDNLSPGLRAAIVVSWMVILLEVLSDVVPVIGFFITIPFAVITYYVQGLMAGRFLRHDPRFPNPGAGLYLRAGLVSAFWTSVVFSTAVTVIDALFLSSVTLGAFLATIPLVLASALVDLLLNLFFTTLAAWLYSRFNGRALAGFSCAILALAFAGLCLAGGIGVLGGIGLLRHLSLALPIIRS